MNPQAALIVAEQNDEFHNLLETATSVQASSVACLWLGKKEDYPNRGVKDVFILDTQTRAPETIAASLEKIVKDEGITLIVLPSTRLAREVGPRAAVALHAGYVEGVIKTEANDAGVIFQRVSFGGTVVEKIKINTPVAVITTALVGSNATLSSSPQSTVKSIQVNPTFNSKRVVQVQAMEKKDDMSSAERIVAAGRGIKKQEDLVLINGLATALDAKFACSRPLVEDLKWCAKDRQVGLSGQIVKPKLYVAIGVSGQIQHTVGMRDSKVIVAINSDKTAPIFQVADYGIVGDLYQLVPEIVKQLGSS